MVLSASRPKCQKFTSGTRCKSFSDPFFGGAGAGKVTITATSLLVSPLYIPHGVSQVKEVHPKVSLAGAPDGLASRDPVARVCEISYSDDLTSASNDRGGVVIDTGAGLRNRSGYESHSDPDREHRRLLRVASRHERPRRSRLPR